MRFNTLKNRLIISFTLAMPSYTLLYLIRGYDFADMTLYSHVEYSIAVFIILIALFEVHTLKSQWLERWIPWQQKVPQRLWAEIGCTAILTPAIVTPVMVLLYQTLWDMSVWFPGMIEYNLFALSFSLSIAAFVNADVIIKEWKKSLLENEILEKENAKARLSVLQAQISPHFLFNNFNVLNALIDEDPKLAQKYLDTLSDIYRYVLNQKNEELVLLRDEIEFIKNYLFLLRIRFNEKLTCNISANGHGDYRVPSATLQILVENAVKHNEISSRHPMEISIKVKGDDQLEVRNNLQPKKSSVKSTEVGLKNISDRYKYFTNKPVHIEKNEHEFVVRIPILKMNV
ncbi:sensor histidine kinase [Gracilimonas sediminicola]|uniref:Histidine kinase n=1 Tax=Gracilimonas sediminicola TaxID=2952158 RepID=A0A9X2L1H7_9BACT|nr:histidine kinase [Gracilimonas sediminicola]MCP9290580.1 histidine kinase [Gracilimonas sediminicola]